MAVDNSQHVIKTGKITYYITGYKVYIRIGFQTIIARPIYNTNSLRLAKYFIDSVLYNPPSDISNLYRICRIHDIELIATESKAWKNIQS